MLIFLAVVNPGPFRTDKGQTRRGEEGMYFGGHRDKIAIFDPDALMVWLWV